MTTKEIAAAAGCSTVYVRQAAKRDGIRSGRMRLPNGRYQMDWPDTLVEYLRERKRAGCEYQAVNMVKSKRWEKADAPRHYCHDHAVECVLPQIGHSCTSCPRVTRYDEVCGVVCDVMADIEHLAEVR